MTISNNHVRLNLPNPPIIEESSPKNVAGEDKKLSSVIRRLFTKIWASPSATIVEPSSNYKASTSVHKSKIDKLKDLFINHIPRRRAEAEADSTGTENISDPIDNLEKSLKKLKEQARAMKRAEKLEKKGDKQTPLLSEMKETITIAEKQLEFLKEEANNLPEPSDKLLKTIEKLEKDVTYAQKRLEVVDDIFKLNNSISKYQTEGTKFDGNPEESWKSYQDVRGEAKNLILTLNEVTRARTELGDDKDISKIRDARIKKETFSIEEVRRIFKIAYPGLTLTLDRLIENIRNIREKRVKKLEWQAHSLDKLINVYNDKAKQINKLEKNLYTPSRTEHILNGFSKALGRDPRQELKNEIEKAKSELQMVSEEIKAKNNFVPDEIDWLKELAKDKNFISEYKQVEKSRQAAQKIVLRTDLDKQLDKVIKKAISLRRSFKTDEVSEEQTNQIHGEIKKELTDLIELIPLNTRLPKNFQDLPTLKKLETLIKINHPEAEAKLDYIGKLVEELDKKTEEQEFNQLIEKEIKVFTPSSHLLDLQKIKGILKEFETILNANPSVQELPTLWKKERELIDVMNQGLLSKKSSKRDKLLQAELKKELQGKPLSRNNFPNVLEHVSPDFGIFAWEIVRNLILKTQEIKDKFAAEVKPIINEEIGEIRKLSGEEEEKKVKQVEGRFNEIIRSERSFNEQIQTVMHYKEELDKVIKGESTLSKTFKGDINQLKAMSKELEKFSQLLPTINTFLSKIENLSIDNISTFIQTFLTTDFSSFFAIAEVHSQIEPRCNVKEIKDLMYAIQTQAKISLPLPSYTIVAIQRLPRYTLLFQELKKDIAKIEEGGILISTVDECIKRAQAWATEYNESL